MEEQLAVLALELNFGIALRKFPMVEYIMATEVFCQTLEEVGDDQSVEKGRRIRNEVIQQLKKSYSIQ